MVTHIQYKYIQTLIIKKTISVYNVNESNIIISNVSVTAFDDYKTNTRLNDDKLVAVLKFYGRLFNNWG